MNKKPREISLGFSIGPISIGPISIGLACDKPDALGSAIEHSRTNESFASEVASTSGEVCEQTESKREAGVRVGRLPS